MTDELDPAQRELILLVNEHGSPAAFRALVKLLNNQRPALDVTDEELDREAAEVWAAVESDLG